MVILGPNKKRAAQAQKGIGEKTAFNRAEPERQLASLSCRETLHGIHSGGPDSRRGFRCLPHRDGGFRLSVSSSSRTRFPLSLITLHIGIVATDLALGLASKIKIVSASIASVNTVAGLQTQVTALGAIVDEMLALYAIGSHIVAVSLIDDAVSALALLTTQITALGARTTEIDALLMQLDTIAAKANQTDMTAVEGRLGKPSKAQAKGRWLRVLMLLHRLKQRGNCHFSRRTQDWSVWLLPRKHKLSGALYPAVRFCCLSGLSLSSGWFVPLNLLTPTSR